MGFCLVGFCFSETGFLCVALVPDLKLALVDHRVLSLKALTNLQSLAPLSTRLEAEAQGLLMVALSVFSPEGMIRATFPPQEGGSWSPVDSSIVCPIPPGDEFIFRHFLTCILRTHLMRWCKPLVMGRASAQAGVVPLPVCRYETCLLRL